LCAHVHTLGEHQVLFAMMKCVYTIYSLSGEQEEQTEEHGPEVEKQEPLPEVRQLCVTGT